MSPQITRISQVMNLRAQMSHFNLHCEQSNSCRAAKNLWLERFLNCYGPINDGERGPDAPHLQAGGVHSLYTL
jgi:hypothetical protein